MSLEYSCVLMFADWTLIFFLDTLLDIYYRFFFLNDTAPTEFYPLPLHDPLPICTTFPSPFEPPASMPPARFVSRRRSVRISSWACDPRNAARANPSPISTPFTAWTPISANEIGRAHV